MGYLARVWEAAQLLLRTEPGCSPGCDGGGKGRERLQELSQNGKQEGRQAGSQRSAKTAGRRLEVPWGEKIPGSGCLSGEVGVTKRSFTGCGQRASRAVVSPTAILCCDVTRLVCGGGINGRVYSDL